MSPDTHSDDFIKIMKDFGPLFYLAFGLALLFGINNVRNSYKYNNKIAWFIQYIMASILTAILAVATALILPLLFPDGLSHEVQLGVTVYVCVFGVKGLDAFARNRLGFSIVNLNDPQDMREAKRKLTPEQRKTYTQTCSLRDDCNGCGSCPSR